MLYTVQLTLVYVCWSRILINMKKIDVNAWSLNFYFTLEGEEEAAAKPKRKFTPISAPPPDTPPPLKGKHTPLRHAFTAQMVPVP
jgi:hypothetical protein